MRTFNVTKKTKNKNPLKGKDIFGVELNKNRTIDEDLALLLDKMRKNTDSAFDERENNILNGFDATAEIYSKLDMTSFVIGVLWCDRHPSRAIVKNVIDNFFLHDRNRYTEQDIDVIYQNLNNRPW
jgi:hypothetical protein